MQDYQREHNTSTDAANYAETVPDWLRKNVVKGDDGKYWITYEWEERYSYAEKTDKK